MLAMITAKVNTQACGETNAMWRNRVPGFLRRNNENGNGDALQGLQSRRITGTQGHVIGGEMCSDRGVTCMHHRVMIRFSLKADRAGCFFM